MSTHPPNNTNNLTLRPTPQTAAEMAFKHHVIALDSWVKVPDFDFPHSLTVITDGSALTRPEQLKDATIAINSQVPVNAALLDHMPNLQLFAATGTGIDHIDKEACHARGITLCKTPAQNTGSLIFCSVYYWMRVRV